MMGVGSGLTVMVAGDEYASSHPPLLITALKSHVPADDGIPEYVSPVNVISSQAPEFNLLCHPVIVPV